MLKIEITLSWNDFPFLAGCLAHQTSVIDHLRLLELELPVLISALVCSERYLVQIFHGLYIFLVPQCLFSMTSLHWLQQKRGLQQTSGCRRCSCTKLSDFSLPSSLQCCSSLHPLVQGVALWFELRFGVGSSPSPTMWLVTPGAAWEMAECSSDIRDSCKEGPVNPQGNFNRILVFCLKQIIVGELLIFSLGEKQSSKSWVILGGSSNSEYNLALCEQFWK